MTVLSIDLAHKRYADIGICSLEFRDRLAVASPIRPSELGLTGEPSVSELARSIVHLAERLGRAHIFIDGPQAWKSPDNDLAHCRVCEQELFTQGKTGLPETGKPSTYIPFFRFAIALFDLLTYLGWPRVLDTGSIDPSRRLAFESFPTSAWRSLGLKPLPGKAATTPDGIASKLIELKTLFLLRTTGTVTHDDLQALVAGLAGLAIARRVQGGYTYSGIPPFRLDGFWREGFIVNPTSQALI